MAKAKEAADMLEVTNLGEHDLFGFPVTFIHVGKVTREEARKHARAQERARKRAERAAE